ncbi:LytR/AlgR family response regulator transcription factor [Rhodohalobacter sp. 8-1]|uniref:LytR/AlgR family response regulator transcription factor n=1 Tax=Rhodohalobacter sp. 8-1 TaxID=3131972 RepID=UPI0030EB3EF3
MKCMEMSASNALTPDDTVLLNDGDKCKLVELKNVRYFETCGNYSKTYFTGGALLINRSLNYLESRLPSKCFFRTSRQYIINLTHVEKLNKIASGQFKLTLSCGKEIEVSRRRSNNLQERLIL